MEQRDTSEASEQNYVAAMQAMRDLDYDSAIRTFLAEPEDSPCYVLARGNAALCFFCCERLSDAENLFDQVISDIESGGCPQPPSHVQFLRNRAEVVRARGRRDEALKRLTEACDVADRLLESADNWRNDILLQKAHTVEAIGVAYLDMGQPDLALQFFHNALEQYRRFRDPLAEGVAVVLTNMAYAYRAVGERLKAVYALEEARDVAEQTEDREQLSRIESILAQLFGSDLAYLVRAADEAEQAGQFETAFIRHCSALDLYSWRGNLSEARRSAEAAKRLIPSLDTSSLHVPKLRMSEGLLMRLEGGSGDEVANILSLGAAEWLDRLSYRGLLAEDFDLISVDLHEHFRTLSRDLKDLGDPKRALLAFEAGRALSTGRDIDTQFIDRVIRCHPFTERWNEIDTKLIDEVQGVLADGEVILVICEIPPHLTAFVVRRNEIKCVEVEIGVEEARMGNWFEGMHMMPRRLKEGIGLRAIPPQVQDLASLLSTAIGSDSVKRFIPYKLTHLVPWRAVLRNAGVGWLQMTFSTEFGLLLPYKPLEADRLRSAGAQSLGFGSVPGIDFKEEAVEFAKAWGPGASYEEPCTAAKVNAAFHSDMTVLISCHGVTKNERLFLELQAESSRNSEPVDALECLPERLPVPLLILSACLSGVYVMDNGDNPVGFAPFALRRGTSRVVCSRWEIGASFAKAMVIGLASQIHRQSTLEAAFVETLSKLEIEDWDLWTHLACVELLGQG